MVGWFVAAAVVAVVAAVVAAAVAAAVTVAVSAAAAAAAPDVTIWGVMRLSSTGASGTKVGVMRLKWG